MISAERRRGVGVGVAGQADHVHCWRTLPDETSKMTCENRNSISDMEADSSGIGSRARKVRRRRGMSLEAAAGLAGISKGHLSRLENGKKPFTRRGLIADLANALSCSVADLTGQPYLVPDQQSATASGWMPALSVAIHDATLDDAPDIPVRPVEVLVKAARIANQNADNVNYMFVGRRLAELITELQVHAVSDISEVSRTALAALVEACMAAQGMARTMGHAELALSIARRGYDAARLLGRDDLIGLTAMSRGCELMRVGARHRATVVLNEGIAEMAALPGPSKNDTEVAESRGMLHLSAALLSARDEIQQDLDVHLEEARSLASYVGEQNNMHFHFGPSNVAAWELTIAVERGNGPDGAERFISSGVDLSILDSKDRESSVHFDLSRAWTQADGTRDREAMQALDMADRLAPLRVRNDPIARDMVEQLDRRAKQSVWELNSLKNRLGIV